MNQFFLKNRNLHEMTLVTSKNHGNEILRNLIQKINFCKVEIMGSIGCKIASIVQGESDIYICLSLPGKSSPKDWDFAAPESILKAAGGAITNLDNQELSYGKTSFEQGGIIVATNDKKTHGSICLEIKKIIQKNMDLSSLVLIKRCNWSRSWFGIRHSIILTYSSQSKINSSSAINLSNSYGYFISLPYYIFYSFNPCFR